MLHSTHLIPQGLLVDVPPHLIEVVLLTVYPEATLAELVNIFCSECLQTVLGKEDLEDPALLRTKLQLAPAADAPPTPPEAVTEALCTLMARLLGSSSILHYGYQTVQDASGVEKARMDHNLLKVDEGLRQNLFLMLKTEQEALVQRFSTTSVERNLLMEGG